MSVAPEKIYEAVTSGRVKVGDLNEDSKARLRQYVLNKNEQTTTQPATANVSSKKDGPFFGYDTPMDWVESTPVGKFVSRASQTAIKTAFLDDEPEGQYLGKPMIQTGSRGADVAADILGTGLGFVSPTPGGVAAPAGGLVKAGYEGSKQIVPRVTSKLSPTAAKWTGRALQGGIIGGTYGLGKGIAQELEPEELAKETLKEAGLWAGGEVLGAGLYEGGKALGRNAKTIFNELKVPRYAATSTAEIKPITLTQEEDGLLNFLQQQGKSVKDFERELKKRHNNIINEEYNFLRQSGKKGVEQGGLFKNEMGEVIGRYGRVSKNPEWYRNFFAEKGRAPSNKELRELAIKRLKEGFAEEGTEIPVNKDFVGLDEALNKLQTMKDKLKYKTSLNVDVLDLEDISGFEAYNKDMYRNFEKVFGKQYDKVKKAILDPFDYSKKANVEFQQGWLDRLDKEVVEGLGIKPDSKQSALVQQFGEKRISLKELRELAPDSWQKIVDADEWFRKAYDQVIDEVNAVRKQIYPNNPDKLIPKRKDYYRHFRELQGLEGFKNIFDTPANIAPELVSVSEFTQPKSKWLSFAQRRQGGAFKDDAVGGFINYLRPASYAIHIDPNIKEFARLAGELSKATGEQGINTKHLNNFINFLRKYSQDLAGKTNPADRFIQEFIPGGRMTFNAINWLNNRVKANVILGNISSTLAQVANIPQGMASARKYAAKGAGKTLKSILVPNEDMLQSGFLKERYADQMYWKFDTGILNNTKKLFKWLMETSDKVGTSLIWNSHFEKALAEGIKNPVKYADDVTRKLIAGRGIGEVPILQKSKIFQVFAPFQLEVANAWYVLGDFVKAKDAGAIMTLLVGNWLLNKGMEKVRGSGVTFDPIDALLDAITEDDLSMLERGGRLAGEVLSNVPLGQTMAAAYPEYGTNIYGYQLPTRKDLFGRKDPTRFGSGLTGVLGEGITDPLTKVVLPFGGQQVEKTYKAGKALLEGGVYDREGEKMKYPVEATPLSIGQGLIFGQSVFPESREYYENKRRPLSDKQTSIIEAAGDKQSVYDLLQRQRIIEGLENEIQETAKDPELTPEEKQQRINELISRIQSVVGQ